jgi:hypothetical protein
MAYARPRQDQEPLTWEDLNLKRLDNAELGWLPRSEWVKAVCFDGEQTGLYVLTDDEDNYFIAHSIDLEFKEEK